MSHKDYIIALGRLMRYAASKRYALIENISMDDAYLEEVKRLNATIKEESGIDIFKEDDLRNIKRYEEFIYDSLRSYTTKNIPVKLIEDDVLDIRKNAEEIPVSHLNNFTFNYEQIKEDLKHMNLSIPSLKTYINTADHLMIYPSNDKALNMYFLSTRGKIKNLDRILLVVLVAGSGGNYKTLSIPALFIFKYDLFQHLFANPVKLFLSILENYGIDNVINNKKRRFFRAEFSAINSLDLPVESHRGKIRASFNLKKLSTGILIANLFSIDLEKYFKDLSNFKV